MGVFIAVGPWTIFPVCDSGDSTMKCHYTAEAEIIVGSLVVLMAVPLLLLKRAESIIIIGLVEAALGVWTILVPMYLMGLCNSITMECRTVGGPALTLWGFITIILSLYLILKGWKGRK
jgi:hypothetical protein